MAIWPIARKCPLASQFCSECSPRYQSLRSSANPIHRSLVYETVALSAREIPFSIPFAFLPKSPSSIASVRISASLWCRNRRVRRRKLPKSSFPFLPSFLRSLVPPQSISLSCAAPHPLHRGSLGARYSDENPQQHSRVRVGGLLTPQLQRGSRPIGRRRSVCYFRVCYSMMSKAGNLRS